MSLASLGDGAIESEQNEGENEVQERHLRPICKMPSRPEFFSVGNREH